MHHYILAGLEKTPRFALWTTPNRGLVVEQWASLQGLLLLLASCCTLLAVLASLLLLLPTTFPIVVHPSHHHVGQ